MKSSKTATRVLSHGSLFSGIGGFDLASEMMGWKNVFHCEWNPFCQTILKYYWPKSISYGDITKTDFTIHRGTIDILTGGFPCQPYSMAGKRLGKEDERHLWPEMLRAIREIQPRYIVGENVYGLLNWNGGLVFNEVQTDLEAEGYEVQPVILPACAVNAPHKRERIWFVAYNTNTGVKGLQQLRTNGIYKPEFITNTKSQQSKRMQFEQRQLSEQEQRKFGRNDSKVGNRNATDTGCSDRQNWLHGKEQEWETGKFRNSYTQFGRFSKFPTTKPTICSGDDGISTGLDGITFPKWRNESIKGFGNAVVPEVPLQIFKAIDLYASQYLNRF